MNRHKLQVQEQLTSSRVWFAGAQRSTVLHHTISNWHVVAAYRRAKRLKKLNRMLQSSIAQAATDKWRRRTVGLLAVILVVHIVCFAVLTTQIDRRYKNAEAVNLMADILAASQQATMRASFMQVGINCLHGCLWRDKQCYFPCPWRGFGYLRHQSWPKSSCNPLMFSVTSAEVLGEGLPGLGDLRRCNQEDVQNQVRIQH
jgi:hypothetical protein